MSTATSSAREPDGERRGHGLTPAERLERLCDPGSLRTVPPPRLASGGFTRVAVTGGRGLVQGRPIVCYAQDSSLAGGSVGTAEAETIVRVLRIGGQQRVPLVAFLESGGARLQEGAASLGGFGRIFFENVALSGRVPQISVVTGTAAGGACYSPALTDFVVMTGVASMFLTGPTVVNEALGEDITAAALGGAWVHERNGVCHFVARDDPAAVDTVRELLGYLPQRAGERPPTAPPGRATGVDPGALVPSEPRRVYDVRAVARAIVDAARFLEVSARWSRNLVTGFARVGGRPVGIVANQPRHLGGIIDVDAAEKGAWFVRTCDAYGLPLLVLVDTPGFMPGTRQEAAGIIRHGAQLLRAFAEARVPRISVILRKAYGGAYIAMNSRDVGASRAFAWPGAEIGILGARSAARILHRREIAVAADGDTATERFARAYAERHLSTATALRTGVIDEVIEPMETRIRVLTALASGSTGATASGRPTRS